MRLTPSLSVFLKSFLFAGVAVPFTAAQAASASIQLQPLTVTASPVATEAANTMQSVTVLTRDDIERSPASTLSQLLSEVNGLTVRRRGGPGSQADLSLRGSNFKQVLVLVNGVPMQNPQSAHLNTNLPISLDAIERIEVVKGPGAMQYGGSASGGVINIITRQADDWSGGVSWTGGSHGTRGMQAHLGAKTGPVTQRLSGGFQYSDSENPAKPNDTDFRHVFYTGHADWQQLDMSWGFGSSHKRFGAWGFYSDTYPNAREETRTRTAWLDSRYDVGQWEMHGKVYWNGTHDRFLTLIGSKGFLNRHETQLSGFNADISRQDATGTMVLGGHIEEQQVESNALGEHRRFHGSVWLFRHQQLSDDWQADLGINRVHYSERDSHWLPSVALAWQFATHWQASASWAKTARAPTYTELYLDTSANQGNAALDVEVSKYAEMQVKGQVGQQQVSLAVYQRRTDDFIDFARKPGDSVFKAVNLGRFKSRGAEANWRWLSPWPWLHEVSVGYSRVHTELEADAAKNGLRFPEQTWRLGLRMPLLDDVSLAVDARRPDYEKQDAVVLANASLSWQHNHWQIEAKASNLLDEEVIETGFAPIAGRWYLLTLSLDW